MLKYVHIRSTITQHAVGALSGFPLSAIITTALKRGGSIAQWLALPTLQIKSTTAEQASNSMWLAICSRRLQPTCVCVAAARLLLDKLVIYGRECLQYIALSCRRISWMEVSLQDDMGRCRAACLLHNSRGVLISTDELLTEPIRLWCRSNTTRKHLTGFWEHLIAFALSSSHITTTQSEAVTACSAAGQPPLTPLFAKTH